MYYAQIRDFDLTNGKGVRVSLFVSGCEHYCKGCFNKIAWNFNYGLPFTNEEVIKIEKLLDRNSIKGLTILGGEPLHPNNIKTVVDLIKIIRRDLPMKDIWLYTGYTFEELLSRDDRLLIITDLLPNIDVLVDGRFEEELADKTLAYRGSSNQRLIDMKETMRNRLGDISILKPVTE